MLKFVGKFIFQGKHKNSSAPSILLLLVVMLVIRSVYVGLFFPTHYLILNFILVLGAIFCFYLTEILCKSNVYSAFIASTLILVMFILYSVLIHDSLIFFYVIGGALIAMSYMAPKGLLLYIITVTILLLFLLFNQVNLLGDSNSLTHHYLALFTTTGLNFLLFFFSLAYTAVLQELKEAKLKAQDESKAKSVFLANISHEIRTPLNSIIVLSELLTNTLQGSKHKSYCDIIHHSGNHLLSLVDEILDFSAIENRMLQENNESYTIRDILRTLTFFIKDKLSRKSSLIEFDVEVDSRILDVILQGDKTKIIQILLNLLVNAIKYTEEGLITLIIKFKIHENSVDLEFIVKDTGIGIQQENLDKIFSAFTRFDKEKNASIEGVGLGLSIVKKVVEFLGGSIELNSVYGEGTTVCITIQQDLGEVVCPSPKLKEENKNDLTGKTILVVDDMESNLIVMEGLLQDYGCNLHLASSGKEAIEKTKQNFFNLIFLDHLMPNMDGVETLKKLRDIGVDVPIVVVTANAIKGTRESLLAEGFTDFLTKPINSNLLKILLQKYL